MLAPFPQVRAAPDYNNTVHDEFSHEFGNSSRRSSEYLVVGDFGTANITSSRDTDVESIASSAMLPQSGASRRSSARTLQPIAETSSPRAHDSPIMTTRASNQLNISRTASAEYSQNRASSENVPLRMMSQKSSVSDSMVISSTRNTTSPATQLHSSSPHMGRMVVSLADAGPARRTPNTLSPGTGRRPNIPSVALADDLDIRSASQSEFGSVSVPATGYHNIKDSPDLSSSSDEEGEEANTVEFI